MIILSELAIRLKALLFVHQELWLLLFEFQHLIENRRETLDRLPVRSTLSFHLQDTQIDSHLNYVPTFVIFDEANRESVRVKSPIAQDFVQPF